MLWGQTFLGQIIKFHGVKRFRVKSLNAMGSNDRVKRRRVEKCDKRANIFFRDRAHYLAFKTPWGLLTHPSRSARPWNGLNPSNSK